MKARLANLPDEQLAPTELVDSIRARRGGKLLNLDRMLLNSPPFAMAWNQFLGAVRNSLSLDAQIRELAICAVAILNRADYEWQQHAPEYLQAGGSQTQLDALRDIDTALTQTELFNEKERATLALTKAMCQSVQVDDACFSEIQHCFPNRQEQVELVGVIATYNMVSRFLEALQIEAED